MRAPRTSKLKTKVVGPARKRRAANAAHTKAAGSPTSNATAVPPPSAGTPPGPKGKVGAIITLLRRTQGASVPDLMVATGWQAHSVRGAIAGAIKKKQGLDVLSTKTEAGRVYRIEAADDAG